MYIFKVVDIWFYANNYFEILYGNCDRAIHKFHTLTREDFAYIVESCLGLKTTIPQSNILGSFLTQNKNPSRNRDSTSLMLNIDFEGNTSNYVCM